MRLIEPVDRLEVKRCFVISNKAKPGHFLTRRQFLMQLAQTKKEVLKFTERELDDRIDNPRRLYEYNKLKWYLASVSPKEIGVWRNAGGLPLIWTKKNLEETSKKVFRAIEEKDAMVSTKNRAGFAVKGILQEEDVIEKEKYLYPIVLPGGTVGREGLKKYGGDIDDGNMRSIALVGDGEDRLTVYIGLKNRDLFVYRVRSVFGMLHD